MDNATLDDWIGQTVEVQFATREKDDKPQKTSGTLQSADERGIVLIYHDAGDRRPRPFFFPWHRIERIHRSAQRTRVWSIQRPWWRRMFGG